MRVSENTSLAEVIATIGWEDKCYMIDPMCDLPIEGFLQEIPRPSGKQSFAQMTLKEICDIAPDWKLPSVLDGLQHLVDRCENGQVFYRYQEGSHTGLAAFTLPEKRKCILICPGGGYTNVCSIEEGYPLAAILNRMGYAAFVVHYRTNTKAHAPNPMDDLAQAVRFIMNNAEMLNVDMEDYAVMGFSAGGHLAASFGTTALGYAHYCLPAPKCLILGYPVITMGEFTHEGSREMLLGKDAPAEVCDRYSVEKLVDSTYPRTFVWQCEADGTVPIQNSEMLVHALAENGVAYQYEVFPGDAHGWGIGVGTAAEGWLERAVQMWTD